MVAVTDSASADREVRVILRGGDEASGLARIVGQYLEQLLGDAPEKRERANSLNGRLGLQAREGDVAITVVFGEQEIAIEEGLEDADAVVLGEVEALMNMLAGRANPAVQMAGRKIVFRPRMQRPLFGYQAYQVMRLPDVHVWSGIPRRALMAAGGVAVIAAVLLIRGRGHGGEDV